MDHHHHPDHHHGHGAAPHGSHSESPGAGDHDKHAGHSVEMFRDKFWVTLLLTIPTLVWGHMLQSALGYTAPHFPGSAFIPAVFGTAVFVYGGWVFIRGALDELRMRAPGMMTLIALAITVAFLFSVVVTGGFSGQPRWAGRPTRRTLYSRGRTSSGRRARCCVTRGRSSEC